MKKYRIITYGCQMNHSDSERIASVMEKIGYSPTQNEKRADLIMINSCSVRQSAIDRIFGQAEKFSKLKTINHKLKTILTGCVLPTDKNKFTERFDLILDIKDLPKLPQKLLTIKQFGNLAVQQSGLEEEHYLKIKPRHSSNFSVSIPIMTGCNNFCSYCAVPHTRGREVSRPAEDIICEARRAVKNGAREIWLLGQNVNRYRSKSKMTNFAKLLQSINNIPGDFWIRFTSPHPKDFSNELIETTAKCRKVAPYLNLPAQSGDNGILKRMNRPYAISQYKNLVKKIRKAFNSTREGIEKNIALSTDMIVGFPGETKKQFENTAKLMDELKFDMAYIAQFSPRPQTIAAKMKDNVSRREKERRWRILTNILRKTALRNNQKYVGKTVAVLVDAARKDFLLGKSRHYKTVKIPVASCPILLARLAPKERHLPAANFLGQVVKTKITDALPWGLKGELIS